MTEVVTKVMRALPVAVLLVLLAGASAVVAQDNGDEIPFRFKYDTMVLNMKDGAGRQLVLEGKPVVLTREFPTEDEEGNAATGTYRLEASKVVYSFEDRTAESTGDVFVTDGEVTIYSDKAIYDDLRNQAIFTGNVRLKWGAKGNTLETGNLYVKFDETGQIKDVESPTPGSGYYYPQGGGMTPFGTPGTERESVPLKQSE